MLKQPDFVSDNNEIGKQMADFYTNESRWELSGGYYTAYMNVQSDRSYNCPVYFFANYAAYTANSVSTYCISQPMTKHFRSSATGFDLNDYAWLETIHGDELIYLFGRPFRFRSKFTDLDRSFSLELLRLWTYFARNGQMPRQTNNKGWPVSNRASPRPKFVEINSHFLREWKFEFEDRCDSFFRPLLSIYKR